MAGTLLVQANGWQGRFIIATFAADGGFTGALDEETITGRWNNGSQTIAFERSRSSGALIERWTGRPTGMLEFNGTFTKQQGGATSQPTHWSMTP